jgi:Tfp pilus assembly protein PilF
MEIAGRLYAEKGLYKDAARVLTRVLQFDPSRTTAALALAEVHYALGNEKAASELMTSNNGWVPSAGLLKLRAAQAQERGDVESAIQDYESAVSSGDASGLVANNLAWAYAQSGVKLDRALELATSAVERNPKNPAVLDTLGVVQLKQRNYSQAAEVLNKAALLMDSAEWKSQRADVYRHLADAYLGAGLLAKSTDARAKANPALSH